MLKFSKGKKSEARLQDQAPGVDKGSSAKRDKSPRINFFPFRSQQPPPLLSSFQAINCDGERFASTGKATGRQWSGNSAVPPPHSGPPIQSRQSSDQDRGAVPDYDSALPKLSLDESSLSHGATSASGRDLASSSPNPSPLAQTSEPHTPQYLSVSPHRKLQGPVSSTSPKHERGVHSSSGKVPNKSKDKDKRRREKTAAAGSLPTKDTKSSRSRALGMFSGWSGKKYSDKGHGSPVTAVPMEPSSSNESLKGVPLVKLSSGTRSKLLPVFGIELAQAATATPLDDDLPLPAVVIRCIEYLDANGLYEVGLYRIPGSTTQVGKLRAVFDKGRDIDLEQYHTDPHSVAGLLKLYLRELPSAALTNDLLPLFNAIPNPPADQNDDQNDRDYNVALHLAEVARRLPDPNYYLFHWLCRHLARIDYYSDINKMNLSNLGLIFCPTLRIKSYIFRALVTQSDVVFPLPRQPPRELAPLTQSVTETSQKAPVVTTATGSSANPALTSPPMSLENVSGSPDEGEHLAVGVHEIQPLSARSDGAVTTWSGESLRLEHHKSCDTALPVGDTPTVVLSRLSCQGKDTHGSLTKASRLSSYDDLDLEHVSQIYDPDVILRQFNHLRLSTPGEQQPSQQSLKDASAMPPHLAHLEHLQQFTSDGGSSAINRSKMTRSQRRRGVFILQQAGMEDNDEESFLASPPSNHGYPLSPGDESNKVSQILDGEDNGDPGAGSDQGINSARPDPFDETLARASTPSPVSDFPTTIRANFRLSRPADGCEDLTQDEHDTIGDDPLTGTSEAEGLSHVNGQIDPRVTDPTPKDVTPSSSVPLDDDATLAFGLRASLDQENHENDHHSSDDLFVADNSVPFACLRSPPTNTSGDDAYPSRSTKYIAIGLSDEETNSQDISTALYPANPVMDTDISLANSVDTSQRSSSLAPPAANQPVASPPLPDTPARNYLRQPFLDTDDPSPPPLEPPPTRELSKKKKKKKKGLRRLLVTDHNKSTPPPVTEPAQLPVRKDSLGSPSLSPRPPRRSSKRRPGLPLMLAEEPLDICSASSSSQSLSPRYSMPGTPPATSPNPLA
ncbi:hypothetical protein IWQ61_005775, partial [Dispira simplex]